MRRRLFVISETNGLRFEIYPWQKLSEDNISGKLSDERFIKLSRDYEQEQEQLKAVAKTLGREVKQQEQKKTNVRKFISVVRKYTDMTSLTPPSCVSLWNRLGCPKPIRLSNSRSG